VEFKSIEERRPKDTKVIYLYYFLQFFNFVLPVITLLHVCSIGEIFNHWKSTEYLKTMGILLAIFLTIPPIMNLTIVYLLVPFLYLMRDHLKQFLILNIVASVLSISYLVYREIAPIAAVIFLCVAGLIVSLYFYCMSRYLKIAKIQVKETLEHLMESKANLFKLTIKRIIPAILLVVWNVFLLISTPEIDWTVCKTSKHFYIFVAACSFILNFAMVRSAFYMMGAAFFNQTSLKKQRMGPDHATPFEEVFQEAEEIAYNKSFGTICVSAILTTLIRTAKVMAENNSQKADTLLEVILILILQCLLNLLDEILEKVSNQAFIYAVLYGMSFKKGAKTSFEKFTTKGLLQWINMDIVSDVLNLTLFFGVTYVIFFFKILGKDFANAVFDYLQKFFGMLSKNGGTRFVNITTSYSFFCFFFVYNAVLSFISGASCCQLTLALEDPKRHVQTTREGTKLQKLLVRST